MAWHRTDAFSLVRYIVVRYKACRRACRGAAYSIDMPAAFSGAPFFSISGPMMLFRYSVVWCSGGTTNVPVASSRACTAGALIPFAVASCNFLTMSAAVPFGRKKPNQVEAANDMPARMWSAGSAATAAACG